MSVIHQIKANLKQAEEQDKQLTFEKESMQKGKLYNVSSNWLYDVNRSVLILTSLIYIREAKPFIPIQS